MSEKLQGKFPLQPEQAEILARFFNAHTEELTEFIAYQYNQGFETAEVMTQEILMALEAHAQ